MTTADGTTTDAADASDMRSTTAATAATDVSTTTPAAADVASTTATAAAAADELDVAIKARGRTNEGSCVSSTTKQ